MTMNTEQAVATREDVEATRQLPQYVPDVDIYETDENLVLIADLPGVPEDSLDVRLEKNLLTIDGRAKAFDTGGRRLAHAEFEPGDYHRSFTLSQEIDQENIDATLRNGVLTLRLPKSAAARVRRIPVSTE